MSEIDLNIGIAFVGRSERFEGRSERFERRSPGVLQKLDCCTFYSMTSEAILWLFAATDFG